MMFSQKGKNVYSRRRSTSGKSMLYFNEIRLEVLLDWFGLLITVVMLVVNVV